MQVQYNKIMLSLMLDRSDNNAPNQALMFSNQVIKHKKDFLHGMGLEEMEANITLDSPIPYSLDKMIDCLTALIKKWYREHVRGQRKKDRTTVSLLVSSKD